MIRSHLVSFFFFNDTATTEIYTLSLHDALPIQPCGPECWLGWELSTTILTSRNAPGDCSKNRLPLFQPCRIRGWKPQLPGTRSECSNCIRATTKQVNRTSAKPFASRRLCSANKAPRLLHTR